MDKDVRNRLTSSFFQHMGRETTVCHEPTETCKLKAIRSHSIPCSLALSSLADNNHVVEMKMKLRVPPKPTLFEFERVGIHKATTFAGLCAEHDCQIFREIDIQTPDSNVKKHLFLLAYRSVIREFHLVLQNGCRFQSIYKERVKLGISPGDVPCEFGLFATAHLANAFETYEYKKIFDQAYIEENWERLEHFCIELEQDTPTLAVSSMFSLDDLGDAETPRMCLNIFPKLGGSKVVFTSTEEDRPYMEQYIYRILKSEGNTQKYLLSKLILQHCENFVINPMSFSTWSQTKKDSIRDYFVTTLVDNLHAQDSKEWMLF